MIHLSVEERKRKIQELEALIASKKEEAEKIKRSANNYNAVQLALKIVLNSTYGCLSNKHFGAFHNDVAGTITAHGRDLIKNMELANEKYWYSMFHKDIDLHSRVEHFKEIMRYIEENGMDKEKVLNIKKMEKTIESLLENVPYVFKPTKTLEPIDKNFIDLLNYDIEVDIDKKNPEHMINIYKRGSYRRKKPVSAYCDTDSLFVSYKECFSKLNIKQDQLFYSIFIAKTRIQPFFKAELEKYAEKYKVKNLQDFELEQISKSIIYLDKKMYVKNVVWDDGIFCVPETNIQAKGIDIVRRSSPLFTRERIYDVIKYFFKNPDTYNDRELSKIVRELKDLFMLQPIENISVSSSCSNYKTKVLDDISSLKFVSGTHYAVKAAAYHNYLLNNNPELKTRYNTIKTGQKVRMYACKGQMNISKGVIESRSVFAFAQGQYPREIADVYAPIDYDIQFSKTVLTIINRFNKVLGLDVLTPKMTYRNSIPKFF
jgi:DNA polymerase elongation subunit (family B)